MREEWTVPDEVRRRIDGVVRELLHDDPAVLLEGPRAVGKSTILRGIARTRGGEVIDLDDLATRDVAIRDPAGLVSGPAPVCLDEYQKAPLLLDAIKAELNSSSEAGRFVLAGSTRYEALPEAAQALTGRLARARIYPFTQAEIDGVENNLLSELFSDPEGAVRAGVRSTTARTDYIDRIVRGGFPMAVQRTPVARARWLDEYVRLTLERDTRELANLRQSGQLSRLLDRLVGQTAQILNLKAASESIGLSIGTAENYAKLLEAVFLVQRLPAWGTTLTARSASRPKLHVIDSGVAARLMRLTPERLARRSPTAETEFGHLLETFVVGEITRQADWTSGVREVGHWRTHDDLEVDLVVERDDGAVIAIEVKSGTRMPGKDLDPLRRLRDRLGDDFIGGVAFYLGERAFTFEDRIHVMPVDRLWT